MKLADAFEKEYTPGSSGDVACGVSSAWVYSETVRDHFFKPRNLLLDDAGYNADAQGQVGSMACGDVMKVWIKVDPESARITECKWRTFGCASAIASTSMMSIMATEGKGMALDEAKRLKPEQIIERLDGLPDRKFHCSVLGQEALRAAVEDYENRISI
jgi:NifU-like protein involved in Fe-S cluster formation